MHREIRWLRASYWSGAIADAGIAVLTLIPSRMGVSEFKYPMGLAAAVIFAWTVLLIWADRKPLERKGVLLLTIFVIAELMAVGFYAVASGIFPVERIMPTTILGSLLIALMAFSYVKASKARSSVPEK